MLKFHHVPSLFWCAPDRVYHNYGFGAASAPSDHMMESLQSTVGLVHGVDRTDIRDGVALSVNLDPDSKSGMVGWRARKHAGLIDVDAPASQTCRCVLGTCGVG